MQHPAPTEATRSARRSPRQNYVVANTRLVDTVADGLDNGCSFMTEQDGRRTNLAILDVKVCVADAAGKNADQDFAWSRFVDLYWLGGDGRSRLPRHHSTTVNWHYETGSPFP